MESIKYLDLAPNPLKIGKMLPERKVLNIIWINLRLLYTYLIFSACLLKIILM